MNPEVEFGFLEYDESLLEIFKWKLHFDGEESGEEISINLMVHYTL